MTVKGEYFLREREVVYGWTISFGGIIHQVVRE
jgi:hypothetical protein